MRSRHRTRRNRKKAPFATVFELTPSSRLNTAVEACNRCIAPRMACMAVAQPVTNLPHSASFHSHEWIERKPSQEAVFLAWSFQLLFSFVSDVKGARLLRRPQRAHPAVIVADFPTAVHNRASVETYRHLCPDEFLASVNNRQFPPDLDPYPMWA